MPPHSQLWRGAACVGQNSQNIWNVFPDVLSALFQPWARCFRYWIYLWCPVSAISFFLPLNTFTRSHCLLLKEIPICLYVGEPSLSHLLSDLCFITPSNLMQVKRGALSHALEVMAWTSHFPHGCGDEMTQWCFLLFMLSFFFYNFNKDEGDSESLPIRTCSFLHAIHFGLSTPSAH